MEDKKKILRGLPSVDELVRGEALKEASSTHSAALVVEAARAALDEVRSRILAGSVKGVSINDIEGLALKRIGEALMPSVRKVVNASGTILHTNIGRALLSDEATRAVVLSAANNINLEMDASTGERGERDSLVAPLLRRLTGAEDIAVVNNNAAAVLITLNTLAEGREVIISRGELIEIGGSFRLPEIIKKSGCALKEVGTTNRTHPKDYVSAINANTALIFKAHTSNYKVVGFTSEVGLRELADIGEKHNIPVIEDLGSGSLVDLSLYGLPKEPVVSESVSTGAAVVTFSGDKLLGGPQAGIIAGKKGFIERIKKNPLKRALRADKLTLSALEATLRLYLNKERLPQRLPTLYFMTRPVEEINKAAECAAGLLKKKLGEGFDIKIENEESVIGGGSLPGYDLPTSAIAITHKDRGPDDIYSAFLANDPPILGRVSRDRFLLDMRAVLKPEDVVLSSAPDWK